MRVYTPLDKTPRMPACLGTTFWQSIWGNWTCSRCHPPASPELVARMLELPAVQPQPTDRNGWQAAIAEGLRRPAAMAEADEDDWEEEFESEI